MLPRNRALLVSTALTCGLAACSAKTPEPSPQAKTSAEAPATGPDESSPDSAQPDACTSGPKLAAIELPATFAVALAKVPIGTMTIDAEGKSSFTAGPDAPKDKVDAFVARFEAETASAFAGYSWSKETLEGETYGCSRQVPKGDPNYPAALVRAFESRLVGKDALSLSPAEPRAEPAAELDPGLAASIELASLHWSSSNPSIGPRAPQSNASIGAAAFGSPELWKAETTKLLDETRVNGVATLREFLTAYVAKDVERMKTIDAASNEKLETGGGYASLEIVLSSGESIRIRNLKQTQLSGYWDTFWNTHLRDRISKFDPNAPLKAPP